MLFVKRLLTLSNCCILNNISLKAIYKMCILTNVYEFVYG